jgi:hypothetical protein
MMHFNALLALLLGGVAIAETAVPITGLQPDRRPPGALVIASFAPDPSWQQQAVQGITPPHSGLEFLKDQGAWYTPFTQPGMFGRYDIRSLHAEGAGKE